MTHALANIGAFVVLAVALGVMFEELDHSGSRILAALRGRAKR